MAQPNPKEIRVVGGEAVISMVAADAPADHGLVAWEAGYADEALEMLKTHLPIPLLFSDVNLLGEFCGSDLVRRLHEERPSVKLVITSGGFVIANDDLPDHGHLNGKSYSIDRLLQTVAMKLEASEKA